MADVSRTPGQPDPIRTGGALPAKGKPRSSESSPEGVEFKALLDKLGQQAKALEETTRSVDDASNLAGAVEGAKASLEDALSLGEELLESFRQNQHQPGPEGAEKEDR